MDIGGGEALVVIAGEAVAGVVGVVVAAAGTIVAR